jgi:hypothetical protein
MVSGLVPTGPPSRVPNRCPRSRSRERPPEARPRRPLSTVDREHGRGLELILRQRLTFVPEPTTRTCAPAACARFDTILLPSVGARSCATAMRRDDAARVLRRPRREARGAPRSSVRAVASSASTRRAYALDVPPRELPLEEVRRARLRRSSRARARCSPSTRREDSR